MNTQISRKDQSLASLIDLGILGHFPLFHPSWIEDIKLEKTLPLTKSERKIADGILLRLAKHKSFDRKQTILFSLPDDERKTFIKVFIKLVESKILDRAPELH